MKFIFLILILASTNSFAQVAGDHLFQAEMGYGVADSKNPDNTQAEYSGIVLRGLYGFKVYSGDESSFYITGSYKFSMMENTSNNSSQLEDAKFQGPGVGLMYRIMPLTFGAEYNFLEANHDARGVFTSKTKYKFNTMSAYVQYSANFDTAELGATFLGEYGTIEKDEIGLADDQKFKSMTVLMHFKYYF